MNVRRRSVLAVLGGVAGVASSSTLRAQAVDWSRTLAAARGQTVYFNAWGGSERINAYLQWVAGEVKSAFGVQLEHVKLADTVEMVRRVRTEKAAGRSDGSADLVWINGENFLSMKREGLLFGPFAEQLPNFRYVDTVGKPTTRVDFSEPVDGLEAPWGMAQLTFFADSARLPTPPQSVAELTEWARRTPGRFTYPKPPQFHGTTFVKQVWLETSADRAALARPYNEGGLRQRHRALVAGAGRAAPAPVAWRQAVSGQHRGHAADAG